MVTVTKTLLEPTITQALLNYLSEKPYKEVAEFVQHLANSPTTTVTFPDAPVEESEAVQAEEGKKKKPLASAAKPKAEKVETETEPSEE